MGELSKASGFSKTTLLNHFNFYKLPEKAKSLKVDILEGKINCASEQEMEAAFKKVVDDFLKQRLDLLKEVDALDVSDETKKQWKALFLRYGRETKKPSLADIVAVGRSGAGQGLLDALRSGMTGEALAKKFNEAGDELLRPIKEAHFTEEEWDKAELMEKYELTSLAARVMLESVPGLKDAILARKNVADEMHKFYDAIFADRMVLNCLPRSASTATPASRISGCRRRYFPPPH